MPVGPRNYPFTDFARNLEKIPPSLFTFNRISFTSSAVCISKTHLCRSDPDVTFLLFYYFTILLFYYFTILLFYYFTILLFYYLLFYYFTILLFYYFTILLFYEFTNLRILREIGSLHLEHPPVPVGPRIYRFTDFARNPEKTPPCLFTLIGFPPRAQQFASRKPTCAGPTQILPFCYFNYFTENREFASRKPTCAGWTQKLPLD